MKFLCSLVLLVLTAAPAYAVTVDLSPILASAIQFLEPILLIVLTWGVGKLAPVLTGYFGAQTDEKLRAVLETSLRNGIAYGVHLAAEKATPINATVEIKNEVVATAAAYVTSNVPSILKHFNVTPDKVSALVAARLDTHPAVTALPAEVK
jgi:hypothetical protein